MVYTCHTFFIRSSADGHLGCFHFLDTVSPGGAWIVVRCLWRCAREWRCGAVWEFRFQLFRRTLRLPSVLAALANVPVRRVGGGVLSSTPSPTVIVCGRFEGGCLDQGEVLPRSGSDLPSSNNE